MDTPFSSSPVIDFHTHAFPDSLADRAVSTLAKTAGVQPVLNGTLGALLNSMDEAGVDQSVVLSIATRPDQFDSILKWSRTIRSSRIIPFLSVHPADPRALERLDEVAAEGFCGIKLHPYYQAFTLDEPRMMPFYERCIHHGFIVLCHTGYDIGFPRDPIASPKRIVRLLERCPELLLVTSHFGAWGDWDEVRERMLGRPIYMDVSYSSNGLEKRMFREFLDRHPKDYLLFGSDSPWAGQREYLEHIRSLVSDPTAREALVGTNAAQLLRKNT